MKIRKTETITSRLYYILVLTIFISLNYLPETAFGETRYDEETRAALAEMNKLFRHLFPLVPDKARYTWKASHLGGALTLDQPTQRQHQTTYIEHIERPTLIRSHSTPASEVSPQVSDDQPPQYDDLADLGASQPLAATQATPMLSPSVAKPHNHIPHSSGRRLTPLGKRGPECMRKCIAQGVLHPVQCHSLC